MCSVDPCCMIECLCFRSGFYIGGFALCFGGGLGFLYRRWLLGSDMIMKYIIYSVTPFSRNNGAIVDQGIVNPTRHGRRGA